MKGLKKGPELKMPELKAPDFVADLFYDLHDRRLLAPLALVIVAIVAAPFLLGGGSESPPAGPAAGVATPSGEAEATQAASLTVVEAKPGLRDYRKRLAARKPTDPFKQRYTAASTKGAELGQADSSSSTSETVSMGNSSETTISSETTTTTPGGTPPSDSPPSDSEGGKPHLTFFTFAIDVHISRPGNGADHDAANDPVTKKGVMPLTPLPGEKAPVVTYMGLSEKGAKVLLMVSNEVRSVSGDATCRSGTDEACQLLEVEPEAVETFVYGPNEVSYRIKVLKIEPVAVGHT
jgi:hypothetical protein